MDLLGAGFSVIVFDDAVAKGLDMPSVEIITLNASSEAAEFLAADPESAYLVSPDLHIAARWLSADPTAIQRALTHATAGAAQ